VIVRRTSFFFDAATTWSAPLLAGPGVAAGARNDALVATRELSALGTSAEPVREAMFSVFLRAAETARGGRRA
jgi:hypothetical protein|tara:strand:- start:570 stop:788 length:219 start_codon:yes stop_codon:yes gene_type:complete